MLTSGQVSWATMVSEPAAVIFLFWLLTLTRVPATIFFRMKRFP
jgi:hypothetical protein